MNPTPQPTPSYEYYVGGSLGLHDPTYVTRQADQDLYEGLRAGDFCYVLNSRQMGKSSLRVQIMQRLQSAGVACAAIYVTTTGSQNITPDKWYAGIIQSLVNSFKLGGGFNLRNWLRERDMLSPVQRFSEFIETVILRELDQQVVIFVDEIDSVLSLDFGIDDFFAVIRECYDRRGSQPEYQRLTFALLGVAAPTDLIQDKRRTPFNIGLAIDLTGFSLEEAQPLALGLRGKAENPAAVLREVVSWTGGQPFLTQKVCKLLLQLPSSIGAGSEAVMVEKTIREQVVENWEAQDVPEHLKTIRDRLLRGNKNEQLTGRLLGLCQRILESDQEDPPQPPLKRGEQEGDVQPLVSGGEQENSKPPLKRGVGGISSGIPADESYEQMQLRLTGLVVQRDGRLIIYNAIYAVLFNSSWVAKALRELRPAFYAGALQAWQEAGNEQKGVFLLRGQALEDARVWARGKRLSDEDDEFLSASQEIEKLETEQKLDIERQKREAMEESNLLLLDAERKAKRRVQFGSVVLVMALVLAAFAGTWASTSVQEVNKANIKLKETEQKEKESSIKAAQANQQAISLQKQAEDSKQQAKRNENLAVANQSKADQSRQQAEVASQNEKLATEKQRNAEQKVEAASRDLVTARTGLESVRQQSQAAQAEAQAKVTAAEVQVRAAEQQRRQAAQEAEKAQEATRVSRQEADFARQQVSSSELALKVGELKLSISEARAAFLDGKKFDALLQAMKARQQLEILDKNIWAEEDIKTRVTLALQETIYGQLREHNRLENHSSSVWSVTFSPDGKTIASASSDNTVKLWNLDGQELKTFNGHSNWIRSVAFSPDGKTLATGSDGKTVKLWNLETGAEPKTLTGHNSGVRSVAFSPNGKTLATGSLDNTVKLWNLETGVEPKTLTGHTSFVLSVAFSPNGKTLATGSDDNTVKLWNLETGAEPKTLTGHNSSVYSVAFSPDGKTIATGSWDKTVKLWNLETGAEPKTLTGHNSSVYSVAFSPDGKTLATGSGDNTVKLWNLEGNELNTLKGHSENVSSVAFSPDGKTLATASFGRLKLWNLEGKELQTFNYFSYSVTFSPDGKTLATAGSDAILLNLDLDDLTARSCNWLRDYLTHNPNARKGDRQMCGIPPRQP